MARLFDDSASEYLRHSGSSAISGVPFSMCAWFYSDDLTLQQYIVGVFNSTSSGNLHSLALAGNVAGDPVRAISYGAGFTSAASTTGYSANTWHHALGVWTGNADRAVYLDGGSKGTNTTSQTPVSMDRTSIAILDRNTPSLYMSGRLAEIAIWDVALSDADALVLAAGYSPLFVKPQSLIAYWPLIRDEDQDRVGDFDMTPFNTPSIDTHPPIIYPNQKFPAIPTAAAPAANIPEFMHHYQQQLQAG